MFVAPPNEPVVVEPVSDTYHGKIPTNGLCAICNKRTSLCCDRCNGIWVCSKAHMKLAWKLSHKNTCGKPSALLEGWLPSNNVICCVVEIELFATCGVIGLVKRDNNGWLGFTTSEIFSGSLATGNKIRSSIIGMIVYSATWLKPDQRRDVSSDFTALHINRRLGVILSLNTTLTCT